MGKYQNLVAIRPSTYRRFKFFYEGMATPKMSQTALISKILETFLDGEGAALDYFEADPDQIELF